MAGVGHVWIPDDDEGMLICSHCDTYRGSRASSKPCPVYGEEQAKAEARELEASMQRHPAGKRRTGWDTPLTGRDD